MKKNIFLSITIIFTALGAVHAQTQYKADVSNSKIAWVGKKVLGEHNGTISLASGTLTIENNMIKEARFEVDMSSIKDVDLTDADYRTKLEGHLKSDDFFGVAAYPKSVFVIDKPQKIEKGISPVSGKITIKGITQPIDIKAIISDSPEGLKIYASLVIDRSKFNIKYGSGSFFEGLGDKTIYDEFYLTVSILATKQ